MSAPTPNSTQNSGQVPLHRPTCQSSLQRDQTSATSTTSAFNRSRTCVRACSLIWAHTQSSCERQNRLNSDNTRWQNLQWQQMGPGAAQPLEANSSGIVLFLCWPHAVISLHSEMMLCILKQNSRALDSIYDMYRYVASSRCLFAQFSFYKWQDSTRCSIKLCRGQPGSCAQERAEQQKERDPGTEETEGR
jgi:hypothetical protein